MIRRTVYPFLIVALLTVPFAAAAWGQGAPGSAEETHPALQTTLTVVNANDSGPGSLRQAIADANPGDTIVFAGDFDIYLSSTLSITQSMTIDGSGRAVTVSGDTDNDGTPNVRVFYVDAGAGVTLTHLSIVSGTAGTDWYGGGIYNAVSSTLTVTHSVISGNSADYGGGIFSWGTLTVTRSVISGNSARYGGGIYSNTPGGSCANSPATRIINSTFSGNSVTVWGGGFLNWGGVTEIVQSTITANTAAAGRGGGLASINLSSTCTRVGSSLIVGNVGSDVAALYTEQRFYSLDYNVVGAAGNNVDFDLEFNQTHDQTNVTDPRLGPLGDNGGDTLTHALLPGSLALNAIPNGVSGCGSTYTQDQRGVSRPQGAACDVGSYESRGFTLTQGGGNGQHAFLGAPFAQPLTLTVSSAYGEPIDGGLVQFVGPASGAGIDPITHTATISGSVASVFVTANDTAGSYDVVASARGAIPDVIYTLTNDNDPPEFTSTPVTTVTQGALYTYTVTVDDPDLTHGDVLTITAPTHPDWLELEQTGKVTATLSGMPAESDAGYHTVVLRVTDRGGLFAEQPFTLTVTTAPLITSVDHAAFVVGAAGSFTVTAVGVPIPTLAYSGTPPSAVAFTDNGDGTATLAGTPAAGTGGVHLLTLTADNGVPPDAEQSFTLTINEAPAITSADRAILTVGAAGTFTVTTAGYPTATIALSGALPVGVTFADQGNGMATLTGTPETRTGSYYSLTLTATNGILPAATQALTLLVLEAPTITSADRVTFTVGAARTFTVTATGFPTVTWSLNGTLPTGLTFAEAVQGAPPSSDGSAGGIAGLSGSRVVLDPTVGGDADYIPGAAQTFCFRAESFTNDWEYVETVWLRFPIHWTVSDVYVQGTPFCAGGGGWGPFSWSFQTAPYEVSIAHTRQMAHADHCTAYYCVELVSAHAGATAPVSWYWAGDGLGSPPHRPCSADGYTPPGQSACDEALHPVATVPLGAYGGGTTTLSGTPAVGTGGVYALTLTARNDVAPDAAQPFTLTVLEAPAITSPAYATFVADATGAFAVTTAGYPTATIALSGTLPVGVTFTDNGDGTATLAGTPAVGSGGVYSLTFTASNGVPPDAVQHFGLTVNTRVYLPLVLRNAP